MLIPIWHAVISSGTATYTKNSSLSQRFLNYVNGESWSTWAFLLMHGDSHKSELERIYKVIKFNPTPMQAMYNIPNRFHFCLRPPMMETLLPSMAGGSTAKRFLPFRAGRRRLSPAEAFPNHLLRSTQTWASKIMLQAQQQRLNYPRAKKQMVPYLKETSGTTLPCRMQSGACSHIGRGIFIRIGLTVVLTRDLGQSASRLL